MPNSAAPLGPTPRLQLRQISKGYPGCLANDAIDLSIAPGEIHALLGENGAGKSTLMKIIYGVIQADSGELLWQGRRQSIASPAQARRLGIGMVFQHFSLFETLSVAQNIALAMGRGEAGFARFPNATACPWNPSAWCTACPSASASGWRSCAA